MTALVGFVLPVGTAAAEARQLQDEDVAITQSSTAVAAATIALVVLPALCILVLDRGVDARLDRHPATLSCLHAASFASQKFCCRLLQGQQSISMMTLAYGCAKVASLHGAMFFLLKSLCGGMLRRTHAQLQLAAYRSQ